MLHSFYPIFLFIIILSTIEVKSARFLHQSTSVYECLLLFTSQSIWNIFPISGSSLVLCPYFFSLLVFIRASCIHSHTRRQDRDEGDDTVHNDSRQSHIYSIRKECLNVHNLFTFEREIMTASKSK